MRGDVMALRILRLIFSCGHKIVLPAQKNAPHPLPPAERRSRRL
jgi:hypothetical protein